MKKGVLDGKIAAHCDKRDFSPLLGQSFSKLHLQNTKTFPTFPLVSQHPETWNRKTSKKDSKFTTISKSGPRLTLLAGFRVPKNVLSFRVSAISRLRNLWKLS